MRLAAVDLGASFIKSALLDTGSRTVSCVERVPFPAFTGGLPEGHREVPLEPLLGIVRQQVDRLLAAAPDCAGVVSCGQMHGLVLADRRGEALTPFISWMDERAATDLDVVKSLISGPDRQVTVQGVTAGSTASILFHLARERPLPDGAAPQSLPDYIFRRLCGSEAACEPTMASGFGVFDVPGGAWRTDAINRLGLARLAWPRIVTYKEPVGRYPGASGNNVPVYASLGDQQCALLGSLLGPEELSINISTGSQVSRVSERFQAGGYQVRAYFDGLFLNTVTHLPAGRQLNPLVQKLSRTARSNGNPPNDPWSASEQTAEFRAAYETMADNYYAAALKLGPVSGWKQLVFSGGLAVKSALLQQTIRNRFGNPSARVSPTPEDTLFGLLQVSLAITGQFPGAYEAVRSKETLGFP